MLGVALVTGASRGIGYAVAQRLYKDGYRVALNDLPSQKDLLEALGSQLSEPGRESVSYCADVSDEKAVEDMVHGVVRDMGGLDVMVANAGICIMTKDSLAETSGADFLKTLSVNTLGTFFCYKYAARHMIEQGRGGRIIGAASVGAKQGSPFLSPYVASKFAIRGLTQCAALDLAKHHITVNAYAPGPIESHMLDALRELDEKFVPPTAIGRNGTPEDIAGLVSYLVTKEAEMITGQSISINGGMFFD